MMEQTSEKSFPKELQSYYAQFADQESRRALLVKAFKKDLKRHILFYGDAPYQYKILSSQKQEIICAFLVQEGIKYKIGYKDGRATANTRARVIIVTPDAWQ